MRAPPIPEIPPFSIREAEDGDAEGLIALIGGVFAEYPGCVLDVDGEMPELRAIARRFGALGGQFWVATWDGEIVGCGGYRPVQGGEGPANAESRPTCIELCKLYVHRRARRRGLAAALCGLVEGVGQARGAAFVELWSDTRFLDAHRLYEKRGYVRGPETRALHDLSNSIEYYFRLPLGA